MVTDLKNPHIVWAFDLGKGSAGEAALQFSPRGYQPSPNRMNRICQGKVTDVEMHNPHILPASNGERNEVRCRIPINRETRQTREINSGGAELTVR